MVELNRNFVLLADNGDRLYPYTKKKRSTGEIGYVVGPPGLGDKHDHGEYYNDIETVIRKVLFDGYSVRAQNDWKATGTSKREGGFKVGAKAIVDYELDEELHWIAEGAVIQPKLTKNKNTSRYLTKHVQTQDIPEACDEIITVSIKSRRGQPKFRSLLLKKYRNKCCVTATNIISLLEAAHIVPHSKTTDYDLENGLLMRSDIHTLFDLNLLRISANGTVFLSADLQDTEYSVFSGIKIRGEFTQQMSNNLLERKSSFASQS